MQTARETTAVQHAGPMAEAFIATPGLAVAQIRRSAEDAFNP